MPALHSTCGTDLKGRPVHLIAHVPPDFRRWPHQRKATYLRKHPPRPLPPSDPCPQFGGHWSDWPQVP